MSMDMWYTKEDVLKDLTASGLVASDLDRFIVRGAQPPPLPSAPSPSHDEEYKLRFGACGDHRHVTDDLKPDLVGISTMLRMVDAVACPEEQTVKSPKKDPKQVVIISKLNPDVKEFVPKSSSSEKNNCDDNDNNIRSHMKQSTITVKCGNSLSENKEEMAKKEIAAANSLTENKVVMAKKEIAAANSLTENKVVMAKKEIAAANSLTENKVEIAKKEIAAANSLTENKVVMAKKEIAAANSLTENKVVMAKKEIAAANSLTENKVVMAKKEIAAANSLTENKEEMAKKEIAAANSLTENKEEMAKKEIAAALKSKFVAASKQNTLQHKKERNCAIAALLKLNTTPCSSPLALEGRKGAMSTSASSSISPEPVEVPEKSSSSPKPVLFTPDYYAGPSCSPKVISVDDFEHDIPEAQPLQTDNLKSPSPNQMDPYIKDSIEKVNKWLGSPQKKVIKKTAAPYMGPVIFQKRKTTVQSPLSEVTVSKKPEVSVTPSYESSEYAAEVRDKIMERIKAKEAEERKAQEPQDIWTKLECDLKARDEVIRKRMREQNNSTSSSKSSSGNRRHK